MSYCAFNDAFLVEGDFIGARLVSADLRGANLRAANFTDADLSHAKLSSTCRSLGERVWVFDATTKFPRDPAKLEGTTIDGVQFFGAMAFLRSLGPDVTPMEGQVRLQTLELGSSESVVDLRPVPVR